MGSLSNYAENKIIDHLLGVASFTEPTNIYLALSTADFTEDGSGAAEPGDTYARVQLEAWDAAAARATANTNPIVFATPTTSWGLCTHWALFDAITSGNMLVYGALSSGVTPVANKRATIAAGEIDISFDSGGISTFAANEMLDHLLKTGAYTMPANRWLALATATIVDGDDGAAITEVADASNYSRTVADSVWAAASGGAASNDTAILTATASGSWGTVTDAALVTSGTHGAGEVLLYHALGASVAIGSGENLQYDIGAFDVTLN